MAILLLLQQRGQVTAREVAEELEVSDRTARRDLEALGMAGIPVYSVQGRGGGWRLAGGGSTDLSGLTAGEARALFLLAGPLAVTSEAKAALRKLLRALPEPLRGRAEAASARVVVDPSGWERSDGGTRPRPPHLDTVQQAVVEGQQLRLDYVSRDGTQTTRTVHPWGVAAKGTTWYLFAGTERGERAFRVDRIVAAAATGHPAERPAEFDLADRFTRFVDQVDRMRTPVVAQARARREVVGLLRAVLGTRLAVIADTGRGAGDGDEQVRVPVEIRGHSIPALAGELAGFGAALEVHEPPELRGALAEIGVELTVLYQSALGERGRSSDGFGAVAPSVHPEHTDPEVTDALLHLSWRRTTSPAGPGASPAPT